MISGEEVSTRAAAPELDRSAARGVTRWVWVVVATSSLWTWLLVSRSYFYADDYLNLNLAKSMGLSRRYLTESVYGHFVVGYRFVDWLFATQQPYNYHLAMAVMVVAAGLCVLVFSRILVELVGPRPGVPVFTAYFAFSMLLAPVLLWWAAFLHTIPAALAILSCTYFFLIWERRRRRWPLVAIFAAVGIGLGFYEVVLFTPIILVLLSWLYLDQGLSIRDRLRRIVGRWPVWAAIALPALVFLSYYLTHSYSTGAPSPTWSVGLGAFAVAWFKGIGPTFAGINTFFLRTTPNWPVTIALGQVVFFAGLLVALLRDWRRTLRALGLLGLGFLLFFTPEILARAGYFGTGVGLDYLYLTPLSWLIALAAALAWYPLAGHDERRSTPVHHPTPSRWGLVAGGAVGVVLLGLALNGSYAETTTWGASPRAMHAFADNFASSLASIRSAHPDYYVYDTMIPANIFFFRLTLSQALASQFPTVRWSTSVPPGAPGYVARADGTLVRANLHPAATLSSPDAALDAGRFCLPARLVATTIRLDLAPALPAGEWSVMIASSSGGGSPIASSIWPAGGGAAVGITPLSVAAGTASSVAMASTTVRQWDTMFPPGPALCVTAAIGTPVPGVAAAGSS